MVLVVRAYPQSVILVSQVGFAQSEFLSVTILLTHTPMSAADEVDSAPYGIYVPKVYLCGNHWIPVPVNGGVKTGHVAA